MDEGFPFDPKVWHEGPAQWWPGLELRQSDQLWPAGLRHGEDGQLGVRGGLSKAAEDTRFPHKSKTVYPQRGGKGGRAYCHPDPALDHMGPPAAFCL